MDPTREVGNRKCRNSDRPLVPNTIKSRLEILLEAKQFAARENEDRKSEIKQVRENNAKMDKIIDEVVKNLTELQDWRIKFVKLRAEEDLKAKIKNECSLEEEFDWTKPLSYIKKFIKLSIDFTVEVGSSHVGGDSKKGIVKKACEGEIKSSSCSFTINMLGQVLVDGYEKFCVWAVNQQKENQKKKNNE
uniref:Uncharacterized protein n=1 Tax=Meloidogyne hapla TaxID=6305 RepID=A0A1I8BWQ5_MELHA